MTSNVLFRIYLGLVVLTFSVLLARADDLTTEEGKTYKDYKVVAQDDKGITIVYTGTQKIAFEDLPIELQKKLGHDPEAFKALLAAKKAQEMAVDAAYAQKETDLNAQDQGLNATLAAMEAKDSGTLGHASRVTITGQIFIAAQGGESIHFDGIEVGLVPIDLINVWLPAKQKRVATELQMLQPRVDQARKDDDEALKQRDAAVGTDKFEDELEKEGDTHSTLDKVVSRRDYFATGAYYTDSLAPYFLTTAVTDLNGKFTISAPANGDFVLTAKAESRLGSSSKAYYWFVKVHPMAATNTYILLDSENMATSGAPDSILKTEDVSAGSP